MTTCLVIQHEDDAPPGWLAQWAAAAGVSLDVVRPDHGERLPADTRDVHGLVVLGGAMGAYADAHHDWLPCTKALFAEAVTREVPALGICLGHQLAAVALGGQVANRAEGPRRGPLPLNMRPEAADDPVFSRLRPAPTTAWNDDVVVELPPGSVVLATDDDGEAQIVRFGPRAWGVQVHPEVTAEIVREWPYGRTARAGEAARAYEAAASAIPDTVAAWGPPMEAFFGLVARRADDGRPGRPS